MTSGPCTDHEIRQQLARVVGSPGFSRNERMSRFLTFLVERSVAGHVSELKESLIAIEVFGRRPGYDPKSDSIVRTEAARLRARLTEYYASAGSADPIVIDVPKGGYVPVVRRRASATVAALPAETPAAGRYRHLPIAVSAALLLLAAAGAWSVQRRAVPIAIAVLPLENLSTDGSNDYLADGLTEDIIDNLTLIDGLSVRSGTSSFAFKGKPHTAHEAGRLLQADYLVEGSVAREADRLRVTTRLIRAADDEPVWSQEFDRHMTDVFDIQDQISLQIVNILRLHLGRGPMRHDTTSVDAYDRYLRGLVFSTSSAAEAASEIPPDARYAESIRSFDEAIGIDHSFAPAYGGLAYEIAVRSVQFPLDHPPDELPKMRAAAAKALELDPDLPEAHLAAAMAYTRDGQWAEAEQAFKRSLELGPGRPTTHANYGYWFLAVLGRHDEAIRELRAAASLDPSEDVLYTTALVLVAAGRTNEAETYCRKLGDATDCMARVSTAQGRFGDAVRLLETNATLIHNPQTRGFLAFARARLGHRREVEQGLKAGVAPNERALIFAGLGDTDGVFEALRQMAALGPQRVGLYLNYPELALVRGDPRLGPFRVSIGLPQ